MAGSTEAPAAPELPLVRALRCWSTTLRCAFPCEIATGAGNACPGGQG